MGSGKEKAGGSGRGGADSFSSSPSSSASSSSSVFDLSPAPPLRRRPLSKVLAGCLTLAVVYSFSLYFAATVGLPMLLSDLRNLLRRRRSGSGAPSSSSSSPSSRSSLPDPGTQREAAVAAEPGIEGVEVVHEFIEVPVYPDEAEEAKETRTKAAVKTTFLHLARAGVDVPVLSLYAGRDSALGVELLAGTERFCHAGVEIKILDSGHWIQLERAEECAERTLRFLERTGGNAAKISKSGE